MSTEDTLDEIAKEFCEMLRAQDVPVLMAYIKSSDDGLNHIRTRHASSPIELISLVSSVMMVLSKSLSENLKIDEDLALQLALDSVTDNVKIKKSQVATEEN